MMRAQRRIIQSMALAVFIGLLVGLFLWGYAQNRPDIQVTSPIEVEPVSVEQGDPVTIKAEIKNLEPVALDQSFDVAFQVQDGGETRELVAGEVTCLTFPNPENAARCTMPGLAARGQPNATVNVRATLNTAGLEPGEYTIFVVADPDKVITEKNENNNSGEPEGFLNVRPQRPNLNILGSFVLKPPQPKQGDLLIIEFTVENDRPASVTAPIPLSLALRARGDIPFSELRPPAIRCPDLPVLADRCTISEGMPGNNRRTIEVQLVTSLLDPGDYQLRVTVDPDNEVSNEADETDNVLTIDFRLDPPPRNLTVGEGRVQPQAAIPGSLIALSFNVSNPSPVTVDGVELGLSLRQIETGDLTDLRSQPEFACGPRPQDEFQPDRDRCTSLRLEANSAVEIFVQFTTEDLSFGPYEVIVTVDPRNLIEETDELDNTLRLAFSLVEKPTATQAGPELHPIGITFTPNSPIQQEQQVLVNATIENSGNQDAGAFRVEFSIRREDGESESAFTTFGVQIVSELRLGKTIDVQSVLDTTGLDPGVYRVQVTITGAELSELDRNNNALIAFITITKPPEEQ
jgi:hypothetical protein